MRHLSRITFCVDFSDGEEYLCDVVTGSDPEWIAQQCAEHYHADCDGWEVEWPVKIFFEDFDGEHRGFEVQRHMVPEFEPTEIDP